MHRLMPIHVNVGRPIYRSITTTHTHTLTGGWLCPQGLKIEGEQPEPMEEEDVDLMLPAKKKRHKKVEFEEGLETLEKDDGEPRHSVTYTYNVTPGEMAFFIE